MKTFNYSQYKDVTWDNEILGYVSQIHEFKGKLSNIELKYKAKINKLVEIAKIQSIESSNKIEGIVTTSTRIKQICENKTMPKTRDEKEILGYRNVLNLIHENYDFIPIKSSYILQLHGDLYEFSEKSIGGRFKNVQNYISETTADGSSFVRFEPLKPYETPDAIDRLCEEFNIAVSKEDVDILILIPIFILDFLCIHPFNDGNGRMSRLLTLLLLYKHKYNVGKFISIEKIIEETKDKYYDSLKASSANWTNGTNNPTEFIKYMLSVILKCYRDFETRADILLEKKLKALNQVQDIIKTKIGKFTKADIVVLCPTLSETTVERCLKELLNQGLIEKHGERKSTFYTRKD
ncbi:MAG: Fic family protein [Clostridia bacterium]|nr:Fic family protein [Clostridia bacterium]